MGTYLLGSVALTTLCFGFIFIARWIENFRTQENLKVELYDNGKVAIALRRGGLYLAIGIALAGSISGPSAGLEKDVINLVIDGSSILIFLFISLSFSNRLVIPGIDNDQAVKENNIAVGMVECGMLVATGLVASGSCSGEGGPWYSGIVFFIVGQLLLLTLIRIYEIYHKDSIVDQVRQGNNAAGLMLAGILVALGIILRASIAGDFSGWQQDFQSFAVSALNGAVLMLIFNKLIDGIFIPGKALSVVINDEKNVAIVTVVVSIKIALAIVVTNTMI